VFGVAEIAVEGGEPEVDELGVAGPAEQVAKAEHVRHPCGDPELLSVAAVHATVVVQPPELAVLRGRPGAIEESVDLRAQRASQVLVEHRVGHGFLLGRGDVVM
jgi:hypothetical protein